MKFNLFSIVIGTNACIASCPFCVSCEKPNVDNLKSPEMDFHKLNIAANLANRSEVDTVMLTSYGEPTLFPDDITSILQSLKPYNFPFIELQTNGILLEKCKEKYNHYLIDWYNKGLTTIAISVVSEKEEINCKNYTPNQKYINLENLIEYLHTIGFCVRLTCILSNGMTSTLEEIENFINFTKNNSVEQVTLRPLNDEYRRKSAKEFIDEHKLTDKQKNEIKQFLENNGFKLLEMDHMGTVYDFKGQNVCLSIPLNKYTIDTDSDNLRQLIFVNNHLKYRWEQEGAILL